MTDFYALVVQGKVDDVIIDPFIFDGVSYPLAERFHPDLIAMLTPCPDYVTVNYTYDGTTWTPPLVPPATGDGVQDE